MKRSLRIVYGYTWSGNHLYSWKSFKTAIMGTCACGREGDFIFNCKTGKFWCMCEQHMNIKKLELAMKHNCTMPLSIPEQASYLFTFMHLAGITLSEREIVGNTIVIKEGDFQISFAIENPRKEGLSEIYATKAYVREFLRSRIHVVHYLTDRKFVLEIENGRMLPAMLTPNWKLAPEHWDEIIDVY